MFPSEQYCPKYRIEVDGFIGYVSGALVDKPKKEKGATELLQIKAKEMAAGGTLGTVTFEDTVTQVRCFNKRSQITKSVVDSLRSNNNVCEEIVEDIEHLFTTLQSPFIWNGVIDRFEIDELGKYVGELLFGATVLHNKTFDGHDVVAFAVPDDSSFEGIDSFLIVRGGKTIGVSSKYGTGARASFFRNILDKVQPIYRTLEDCELTRLCNHYRDHTREAIYNYGIKEILGLQIDNPYRIYDAVRKGKTEGVEADIMSVMVEVQNRLMKDKSIDTSMKILTAEKILRNMPFSITSYLCRLIADRLNNCSTSMAYVRKILADSPIYQVHLDQKLWSGGTVKFDAYHVKASDVKIVGNKSAIEDITASQGMLNYELKTAAEDKFEVKIKGAA